VLLVLQAFTSIESRFQSKTGGNLQFLENYKPSRSFLFSLISEFAIVKVESRTLLTEHIRDHLDQRIRFVRFQVSSRGTASIHENSFLSRVPMNVAKENYFSFHIHHLHELFSVEYGRMEVSTRALPTSVQVYTQK